MPNTQPLTNQGDIPAQMVAGIDKYLLRELASSIKNRTSLWNRDITSTRAYLQSIEPNRQHFRKLLGITESRPSPNMQLNAAFPSGKGEPGVVGNGNGYHIYSVRWSVLPGVDGEGLLLVPAKKTTANIIAIPDCDWTPEMLCGLSAGVPEGAQFARRLAENGCTVIIPLLINRENTYSGIPGIGTTNEPHREFLWRAAYEMGRGIIGYEVQKTLSAVDWFTAQNKSPRTKKPLPLGIIGYGEGGLVAMYSAAVDTRIDATVVSGYFQPREQCWNEPIYRNLFGLLAEFGDAEIASLITPRDLIIEASRHPEISGPPKKGGNQAAPGSITTPPVEDVKFEFTRAQALTHGVPSSHPIKLTISGDGAGESVSDSTLSELLKTLGSKAKLLPSGSPPVKAVQLDNPEIRLKRQFDQIAEHTQVLMRDSPSKRKDFWSKADYSSPDKFESSLPGYKDYFWKEVVGYLPKPTLPPNVHTRKVYDTPKFDGYEVTIDLYQDVFSYGIILIPKGIKPGEHRAVVVCQHGLEGRVQDVADPTVDSMYYHRFACQLAEQGYITFAPQNPYIGEDKFRLALRKAQPLKLTLFSFIVRQHERILEWLSELPYVDSKRIAFYGLSYGGKTAMRVPSLLPGYCLSICSGDYNEWIWKCASMHSSYSYLLLGEPDMPEFDLANTFNYAEMSRLIFPRPFMVERGHDDGVAPDEWVAYEYAKTRHFYDKMGLGDRTEIEFFNGPHTIHGVGTFAFLHKHLRNP